jgi:hypothetical protein
VVASLIALTALLVPLFADSTASATSLRKASVSAATTCPTDPYTGSTLSTCGTTTTTTTTPGVTIVVTLTISDRNGVVKWQACGFPASAAGSTVQLYVSGQLITVGGGSAAVLSGGCTADPGFPICLVPGNYSAVAVDQFGQATNMLPVTVSGCHDPISLAVGSNGQSATGAGSSGIGSSGIGSSGIGSSGIGSSGTGTGTSGTSSSSGALAFTGTNVLILLLIAALLIVLGYAMVRLNRQRRGAG